MDACLTSRCMELADELTQLYSRSSPPFPLAPLIECFGVAEVRERPLDRDACLRFESGLLFIDVNSLYPLVRRRLSIAHEIGHLIVERCSSDSNGDSHWGHQDPAIEALCDRLAGQLLAPEWALRQHFDGEQILADWHSPIRCSTIIGTASRFGISVDAAASRIFCELRLAPDAVAIIWRYIENTAKPSSEKALRIASAWHSMRGSIYIPRNKTAPMGSVVRKASERLGVFSAVENFTVGTLRGSFQVEASGFGPHPARAGLEGGRSVLSLVSPHDGEHPSTTNQRY